jgi:hypothetical protein
VSGVIQAARSAEPTLNFPRSHLLSPSPRDLLRAGGAWRYATLVHKPHSAVAAPVNQRNSFSSRTIRRCGSPWRSRAPVSSSRRTGLAGLTLRIGKLVEVLLGWAVREDGGVYAAMPLGRLMPAKTRLFADEIATVIKAGGAEFSLRRTPCTSASEKSFEPVLRQDWAPSRTSGFAPGGDPMWRRLADSRMVALESPCRRSSYSELSSSRAQQRNLSKRSSHSLRRQLHGGHIVRPR